MWLILDLLASCKYGMNVIDDLISNKNSLTQKYALMVTIFQKVVTLAFNFQGLGLFNYINGESIIVVFHWQKHIYPR